MRANEKAIATKRVTEESGAETTVRVEAKAQVRDQDVEILKVKFNKFKAASNVLKRAIVEAKEETKEKVERSRAEVEADERAAKEEKEAALHDMIQAEVEYWKIQERAMIEEYARDKAEADTEAGDMMREKAEGIERARDEAEAKASAEDDMRKQVWRSNSLGLRDSKNS